ncbi:hypothetical protein [Acinetobacter sp. Marseille-Q1618]|uniref:hypothetical protein n=1 Tax=Acinetobacter sp. Marseille-Q1618 TaxID=2697502 RepID=UPI00156E6DA0|nr:hypothetical protein [Acinetobacter sp. Marseille-Q1618]
MNKLLILPLVIVFFSACAVSNDKTQVKGLGLTYQANIKQDDNGHYVAEVEAAPGAGRKGGAESYAIKNATDFCAKQNKSLKVIKNETASHLWINGVAKVTFQCN